MDNTCCVYMHTCPNGKVYIGVTQQTPMKRWKGGSGYNTNSHFRQTILKYGWDNIRHEVLYSDLSRDEACHKEIELIAKYKSNDRQYGYNNSTGGERNFTYTHTDEAKKKMSAAKRKPVMQIEVDTDKVLNVYDSVLSASLATGINKVSIQYSCVGRRKTAGGFKWQYQDEPHEYNPLYTHESNSKQARKKHKECQNTVKSVGMYDKTTGELLVVFASVKEAAEYVNISIKSIYNVCSGYKKSAGGYVWKYNIT